MKRHATAGDWIEGARLRTLTLGVVPVILGTVIAYNAGSYNLGVALLCLAVAVLLQIGVNYSNDYSDGIRGTDKFRVGPARLTGAGLAKPRTVLTVALVCFGLAGVAGIVIVVLTGHWWLLAVGAAAILAAWYYTGGRRPYGYNALGEVFVFLFFGVVAVIGTEYVQVHAMNSTAWVNGAVAAGISGFFACSVLMINNVRDIEEDRLAGKKTLAVVVGRVWARVLFGVFLLLPYVLLGWFVLLYFWVGYTYFTLLLALPALLIGVMSRQPRELIRALQMSSITALLYAIAFGVTLAFQP
ncbi:1,4-dihydroxy-2-naphthoate polyprenyltransferase [Curtobacterium ammoniigenes]|uniref:1,4-dihydroxy-2-naphthoate polyprenyltransferase n=1 Tax=Curtobacterium ammoniigenes TaxID=395387 RepID=UPI00082D25F9|nr:1,4-dihydroxy-2-naphthoate polyprenyltransferase [Curtobacterium ammoniigenes]